ncbi:MAG: hypothetical protein IKP88_06855 [Lachnospiraceae bacterium]|nr:hypothetical protein [Erysipelotrichaceae bacterium]MBR4342407.1 hypothetical protein [Lachnospiraceae bacterium]
MNGSELGRRIYYFRTLFSFKTYVVGLKKILNDPSIYPEMDRKSKFQRFIDNIVWLIKNHEINRYYNTYGLDIKNFRNPETFVPYRRFAIQRDNLNLHLVGEYPNDYNRICILRDKSVFAAFVSETIGSKYVVPVLASTDKDNVYIYRNKEIKLKDYLETRKDKETILKKIDGECGEGVYLLAYNKNEWVVNHNSVELNDFVAEIEKSKYIIQDRLKQHEALNRINPACINTIRFVTILDNNKKAQEFAHFLRIGVGDSIKDNRATGGYAVNISSEGILGTLAIGHHDSIKKHPDTNIVFEGIQIPYWKEVVDLVKKTHEQLPDIKSIGWDVAITPSGPVLIEGNDNWEIGGPQDMEGGLKDRWNKMISS